MFIKCPYLHRSAQSNITSATRTGEWYFTPGTTKQMTAVDQYSFGIAIGYKVSQ